jgi:hypothetical protein
MKKQLNFGGAIAVSALCVILSISLGAQSNGGQKQGEVNGSGEDAKRLRPGTLYASGEAVYAPRYGFSSVIPDGWEGALPLDTEIFLLMPATNSTGAEIYTFVSEQNELSLLRERWAQGISLSESIRIKATSLTIQGDMISSEVVPEGDMVDTSTKGFAVARCGPFRNCITSLAIGPAHTYEQMKSAVESFMSKASFSEPSSVSIYVDFDWKEFLSGKSLFSLVAMQGASGEGTKENIFHLCSDGSFKGRIKKKGAMKQFNADYKGDQSGTWSTASVGETGVIKLNFKKLPAVEFPISIKEEKIFVNDERYFAAESTNCTN